MRAFLRLDLHLPTLAYRAATVHARERPEWPPHPDRIFSALVCAWGEQDGSAGGEAALRWLEALEPPLVDASDARPRGVARVYVPPNDDAVRARKKSAGRGKPPKLVAPLDGLRPRQARTFPAAVPDEPHVRCWWAAEEAEIERHLPALDRLARMVGHLGHSASLAVLRFSREPHAPRPRWVPGAPAEVLLRVPYPGRFEELRAGWARMEEDGRPFRPQPAPAVAYRDPVRANGAEPRHPAWGRRWIVLAGEGPRAPALEAFVRVAEAVRGAILAHAEEDLPPVLTGHGHDGPAHLAVLPLANVGFARSDGRLFGVALALPAAHDGLADPVRALLERAVAAFLRAGRGLGIGRFGTWRLVHDPAPERVSLQPWRYLRRAHSWASVTPVVLPRHMKAGRGDVAEALVAEACSHVGLPRPEAVEAGPHPFLPGTTFARRRPAADRRGIGWCVRDSFGHRSLVHARIRFSEPVPGPVLLGAGRHFGLGLMLPVEEA